MIIIVAVIVGILFAAGTFLILQRTLSRIILGLTMCSNGVNMLLMLAGGRGGVAAFADGRSGGLRMADPMPQAMALTTIVINFAMVAFLLALAYRSATLTGVDEVEDDLEDRRIAQTIRLDELAAEIAEEDEEGDFVDIDSDGEHGSGSSGVTR
ncbi:MAG TPA: NADH-quinone oxidoreductase subunit K [Microthrixaceae bacterium]|nr:NADH-quinone oxidoreductase subunit K [Microthrixaceae bacterium]